MNPLPRWIGCCVLALTFPMAVAVAAPDFPERKTITAGVYKIEYSAGDEAFAKDIADRIDKVFEPDPAAPPLPAIELSLAILLEQREDYLAVVCRYLHLAKPTPQMSDAFDKFHSLFTTADNVGQQTRLTLRSVQLWRGPELKARLEAGQAIPNITLQPNGGGANFKLPFFTNSVDFSNWSLPIMVTSRDSETGSALAEKKINQGRDLLNSIAMAASARLMVFLLLHETAEIGLIENYLQSEDRRWFCDGVANYIAYKTIEEKVGVESARRYYDLNAQLSMYADLRPTIRLEKWPALENQSKAEKTSRTNFANYAFATEVIFKAAAKHGDDFLPRLLADVGETKRDKTSMKTVYRAYKKLYREDLRGYLPKVK